MNAIRTVWATLLHVLPVAVLCSGSIASAASFDVNTTSDATDSNPGDGACVVSTGGSNCSLRAAIMEANALPGADTVVLDGKTYTLSIPGVGEDSAATGDLDITESVTIQSAPGLLSIIDAAGIDRVIDIHAAASPVLLVGLVIRRGATTGVGGGLRIGTSGQVTVQLSSIEGNLANEGGGISTRANNTLLQFSIVTDNEVAHVVGAARVSGSGILFDSGGTLRLEAVAVHGNIGVTPSLFPAQAIFAVSSGAVQIFSSTISSDTTPAGAPGAGLVTIDTDVLLQNATIANGNFGLRMNVVNDPSNSLFMRNTIIANNAIDCDIAQAALVRDINGYNLDSDGSCLLVNNFGNLPATDPQLAPLAFYGFLTPAHLPLPGSPVIDAGSPNAQGVGDPEACFPFDQQGLARTIDGDGMLGFSLCDMGAVERPPPGDDIFSDGFEQ